MATFTFATHTLEVKYPESSTTVQFGRGYQFASKPKGPDQVTYILHFKSMFFFLNSNGTLNKTTRPTLNMAVLEDFYNTHKMYEEFVYPHPTLGNLNVRFSKPLAYKIMENGHGATDSFTLEITTQP